MTLRRPLSRSRHRLRWIALAAAGSTLAGLLGTAPPAQARTGPAAAGAVQTSAVQTSAVQTSSAQPAALRASTGAARPKHTVTWDGYSFLIDGNRVYLWSGEVHPFRLPSPDLWLDVFQKMKAAGFNSTSLYFNWGYHSTRPGHYDFTGVRDVEKMLDLAEQAGLYVIARPAPYINAEVDSGGLPGWLTTKDGANRSADPKFLAHADEWLTRIDAIIARHQITDGGGSVIAYQVENEYYNATPAGRAYIKHLSNKARADGITVPLIGNHQGNFNSGDGALDVDGSDYYPQGFNCSNPSRWNGAPNIASNRFPGKPVFTVEFQGGAFDPWGGPGYAKCAELINDRFANVFYKQNIAVGSTAQNFYMLYGGTSWGWLSMPQNYTSYDYGAAIRENRLFDGKYAENKLIGYLTQAVPDLAKTDAVTATAPDNAATVDTLRINPDTNTQFHTLRHRDSTSTAVDTTRITVDLGARVPVPVSYTYDDPDPALQYSGNWQQVANQSYTVNDYKQTESFSKTAGDSLTVPFTGTAVRWIGSRTGNHGFADVYLDGVKVATVDTSGNEAQAVLYRATGLTDGPHTLKIVVTGTRNTTTSTDSFVAVDAIDLTAGPEPAAPATYPVVPQQPGTAITLDGRDSKILLANYRLGRSQLQYSTSELMTHAAIGGRDVAVLYGTPGSDGETVLRYRRKPSVKTVAGTVTSTWDPATGDLRLNYSHNGLARVQVTGGGVAPLTLLLADKPTATTFWRLDTSTGPVLVRGSHLLRTATSKSKGTALALTGDVADNGRIEVFTAAKTLTWNGRAVRTWRTDANSVAGVVPVAKKITLPALKTWRYQAESPEADPAFDDSGWVVADKTSSFSITPVSGGTVLFADDYGFHTGNVWYRGRFRATGAEQGIRLSSPSGGGAQAFSVWLNGTFLGSSTTGSGNFSFPAGSLRLAADNVVSVLTVNMGHELDYNSTNGNKAARGLTSATLLGAPLTTLTWRLQGVRGGENPVDTVRGPLSTGGLFGERAGWSLPGYPDGDWKRTTLPSTSARPGVAWYRTDVKLALPAGQDTSIGLTFDDDPSRKYRVMLFVNGWHLGNYVNYLGPQRSFPIPNGILRTQGSNSIALAVWNLDGSTGGLGKVSLTNYGSYASALKVGSVRSPGYDKQRYAVPAAPGTAVTLALPDTVTAGTAFTATTTVSVPARGSAATGVRATLQAPAGWKVTASTGTTVSRIAPGGRATVRWQVEPPAGELPAASALTTTVPYRQAGRDAVGGDERLIRSVPSAPSGTVAVSDLPFLTATNGWGPVERDRSNGEQVAGDGRTLTINGSTFDKGLGTNSPSEVQVYLGGRCTRFAARVGVDDEQNGAGTVTFTVQADGRDLVTTPVIRGRQPATPIDVDVTGAQVLGLVVGDGGDGNGQDHADWGAPTLTCG